MAIKENPDSYSDADIDRAVKEEAITAEDGEALKAQKLEVATKVESETKEDETGAVLDDINYMISSGNIAGATANADKLKAEGKMDDTTYKQVYYDSWKAALDAQSLTADNINSTLTDIRVDADSGKLSKEKCDELIKYAWSKVGKAYTKEQAGVSDITHPRQPLPHTEFYINGVKYENNLEDTPNDSTKAILNGIATGDTTVEPKEGTFVEYNGKMYAYMEHADTSETGGWLKSVEAYFTAPTIIGWVEIIKS